MNDWIQVLLKVTSDAGQQILSAAVEATKEEMKNFEENRQQKVMICCQTRLFIYSNCRLVRKRQLQLLMHHYQLRPRLRPLL